MIVDPGMSDQITVLKIEIRPDDGRPLKAFADVELAGGMIIRSLRVVQEPGKFLQVLCPHVSINPPGRPAYFKTLITLPEPIKGAVDFAVLCAFKKAVAGLRERDNGGQGLDSLTPENY